MWCYHQERWQGKKINDQPNSPNSCKKICSKAQRCNNKKKVELMFQLPMTLIFAENALPQLSPIANYE